MDYGDGKLNGILQFNTKYRQQPMCSHISSAISRDTKEMCIKDYVPVCGNGLIEEGEDCDDTSGCCDVGEGKSCRLKDSITINGVQKSVTCTGVSECCVNCQRQASTTFCANGEGYCGLGAVCNRNPSCAASSTRFFCTNPTPASDGCKETCKSADGACGQFKSNMADDTVCNTERYSLCKSGVCEEQAFEFSWQFGAWSQCKRSHPIRNT